MEVKVCKNCRRLFKYMYGQELCQDCKKLLAEEKQEQGDQRASEVNSLDLQNTKYRLNNQGSQNLSYNKSLAISPLIKEEEVKFEQVRDYIMSHPRSSVAQIAEVNDVSPTKLFEWIRDERLEFSDDSEYAWFICEKCGTKIKSGRLCNRCKTK